MFSYSTLPLLPTLAGYKFKRSLAVALHRDGEEQQRVYFRGLNREIGGHGRLEQIGRLLNLDGDFAIHHAGNKRRLRRDALYLSWKISRPIRVDSERYRSSPPHMRDVRF